MATTLKPINASTEIAIDENGAIQVNTASENNQDTVLYSSGRVTVGVSATLSHLLSAHCLPAITLPSDLVRIAIIPDDSTIAIYYRDDSGVADATAAYPKWPAGGESVGTTRTVANSWRFFSAGTTMTVQVFARRS